MKRKLLVIFIASLVGLFSALTYAARIQHLRNEIIDHSQRVPVLTVNRKISIGETLKTEDLDKTLFLKKQLSGRTISPENLRLIAGRRVIHPIPPGDPILWTDFSDSPRIRFPTEKIPPGFRMIALPADEVHTLSHFISPGDKVDIVSSVFDNTSNTLVSSILATDVVVLGVGDQLDRIDYERRTSEYSLSVSLLVLPETALAILKASQVGEIHFLAQASESFPGNRYFHNQNSADVNQSHKTP